MGVDTKGCVVTENKDVFAIQQVIENWWNKLMKVNNKTFVDYWGDAPEWRSPRTEVSSHGSLQVCFRYKGEDRQISIALHCDCDLKIHEEIEGNSCIWFSLGCWGNSVELMYSLMQEFKDFGDCYVDENDCDDVDFVKI